jgi:hypothetical protein
MTNGFYNTDKLTPTKIRKFINDALQLSYSTVCQTKGKNPNSWHREVDQDLTIKSIVDTAIVTKGHKLYVIDRHMYNRGVISKELCEYEIALVYDWHFLYIFVNEENFNLLVEKHKLKLKEWN